MPATAAIYYHDDGFVEVPPGKPRGKVRTSLMGRRVAGSEFLLACLRHAQADPLYALVPDNRAQQSLAAFRAQPSAAPMSHRRMEVLRGDQFHKTFFPKSPVAVIHYPSPMEQRFAWTRQYGGPTFALSGITHTISTTPAMAILCSMITAPFEPFDALICISRAAVTTVRRVTDNYCSYLRDRFGGNPTLRPSLVNIPLGVDTNRYRPPTPEERAEQRRKYGIADDEVVVLYLGRLLYHGKVHPFPIYQGLVGAANSTGKKVRLILAGWSPDQRVTEVFKAGAKTFAPRVTTTIVDGTLPDVRWSIWWAADIFVFPTDNIQETFPQSVIEAMACGLPVVAADWDGCRDQVEHGKTGLLVPTRVVPGATDDATSKLIIEEVRYDDFLGRCNQTVAVDLNESAKALASLLASPERRAQMGQAGRQRAVNEFSWEKIVARYESLWADQEKQRQDFLKTMEQSKTSRPFVSPVLFPPPEISFASYPSMTAGDDLKLEPGYDAERRLIVCLKHPLTVYNRKDRCCDPQVLANVLSAAKSNCQVTVAQLLEILITSGVNAMAARATIAWMMKYGILETCPL